MADAPPPPAKAPVGAMVVSALVAVLFGIALIAVFKQAIPEANIQAAMLLIGIIVSKFGDVIAYWVGSSRGSAVKSEIMEHTAATLAAKVPAPPPIQPAPRQPPAPPADPAAPATVTVTAPASPGVPEQTITAQEVQIATTPKP